MEITQTLFEDVLLFKNKIFEDERGLFSEHFDKNQNKFF